MSVKGFIDIKASKNIPFSIIDDKVEIIQEFDISTIFGREKELLDKVYGITSDNRRIIFLDAMYNGISFVPTGWITSYYNLTDLNIDTFDAIAFSGKPIDVFYSPKKALQYEKINDEKRMANLLCKPIELYKRNHCININGEKFNLIIDVSIIYDLKHSSRSIGEVKTSIIMKFNERKNIDQAKKYYLYMLDFFRFTNFRMNIEFDNIITLQKTDRGLEKCGRVYFYTRNFGQYNSNEFNSITYDDSKDYFEAIFENICCRRTTGIINQAYIPENDSDFRTVDPIKFLSCALTFEGEYKGKFGIKRRKCLQVKFNETVKYYKPIIEPYIKRVITEEHTNLDENSNLGQIFAKMRNSIGHGDIIPIEREHVAVYRIVQYLIYIIILDKSGVEWDVIKKIINKLF